MHAFNLQPKPLSLAERLADLAVDALIDEADLSPKPALVDRRGNGAHTDLHLGLMHASALSLVAGVQGNGRSRHARLARSVCRCAKPLAGSVVKASKRCSRPPTASIPIAVRSGHWVCWSTAAALEPKSMARRRCPRRTPGTARRPLRTDIRSATAHKSPSVTAHAVLAKKRNSASRR